MIRWHEADLMNRMYVNIEGGKKICMPRYFKERIYTQSDREMIGLHARSKMLIQMEKFKREYQGDFERDQDQAKLAAFKRMRENDSKDETL